MKFDKPPFVIVLLEVFDSIVIVKYPVCDTPGDGEVDAVSCFWVSSCMCKRARKL
jgi:hypothetical protein